MERKESLESSERMESSESSKGMEGGRLEAEGEGEGGGEIRALEVYGREFGEVVSLQSLTFEVEGGAIGSPTAVFTNSTLRRGRKSTGVIITER